MAFLCSELERIKAWYNIPNAFMSDEEPVKGATLSRYPQVRRIVVYLATPVNFYRSVRKKLANMENRYNIPEKNCIKILVYYTKKC